MFRARAPLPLLLLLLALPAWAKPPRLTLFITVDAMGSDLLLRTRPRLQGGLGKLLDSGAFYPYARYDYAKPRTAPGHATLATGANPCSTRAPPSPCCCCSSPCPPGRSPPD